MTALALPDGEPDGLVTGFGGYDELFEFVEPLAGFEQTTDDLVTPHEDATCGVGGGVAHVDANALEEVVEVGATEQQR